jgi:hypothetical protein
VLKLKSACNSATAKLQLNRRRSTAHT